MSIILAAPQLLDLKSVFSSAPIIYSLLSFMSVASMVIWLYSVFTFRTKDIMPENFRKELRTLLETQQFERAHKLCNSKGNILASLVKTGLTTRDLGPQVMLDAMKTEGKRASTSFWQRLSLLNDIVIIAPMLGLLGTVIGMFYAFYDVNRSIESINALFDGLGIAVGTTVMGLIVAILAMIFYTTLKYRVVRTLSLVETEAFNLSALIYREGLKNWELAKEAPQIFRPERGDVLHNTTRSEDEKYAAKPTQPGSPIDASSTRGKALDKTNSSVTSGIRR